jgi:hypothetical protein
MAPPEVLGSACPVAVAAAATWLLHKRTGLPIWQTLVSVLLGLAGAPAITGDQMTVILARLAGYRPASRRPRPYTPNTAPRSSAAAESE